MVRDLLSRIFSQQQASEEDRYELIVSELEDHPDKLFIWQFPESMTEEEMEEKWNEYLEDHLSHGMKSEHIAINWKVDVDTLVAEDGNVIRAREDIFKELSEE